MRPTASSDTDKNLRRQRQYKRDSKLEKYADEIVLLRRDQKYTFTQIQEHLQKHHRLDVSRTTVMRWIKKYYADLC